MTHRRSSRVAALAVAALLVAAGCGEDTPAGPAAAYAGAWTGTTSQGRVFDFYVTDQGIVLAVVSFRVVGTTCTVGLALFRPRESPDPPFPITGGTFAIQTGWSGGPSGTGTVDLAGSLTSNGDGSGTLTANATTCGGTISETWTASRATGAQASFTGTWLGTFSSNLTTTDIDFVLTQTGGTLSGGFTGPNGLTGTVNGTVSGHFAAFRLTETTAGCPGRFDGHAVIYDGPPRFMYFAMGGSNCLGTHSDAGGFADPL